LFPNANTIRSKDVEFTLIGVYAVFLVKYIWLL